MMHNKTELYTFFSKNFPFNKEGLDEFIESFHMEHHLKGDILLRPDQVEQKIKYILQGYVRTYYTSDVAEINSGFYGNTEFVVDFHSFFEEANTTKWQECLTNVKLLAISKDRLNALMIKYSCANAVIQTSFLKIIGKYDQLERNIMTKSAEERYKDIIEKKPEWLDAIPQYHIASYLNITPETLSRIRKRIY